MPLPKTASTIGSALAAGAIDVPDGIVIEIDEDPDLCGRGLYGYTWPDGFRITLYCDAFTDDEQLLRTLVHELVHVRQVRAGGAPSNSVEIAEYEREAYAEEEQWWKSFLEQQQ